MPQKPGKRLLGGSPAPGETAPSGQRPQRRLPPTRNDRVARSFCDTQQMPPKPPTGGPFDCDEYAFVSSYEVAARHNYAPSTNWSAPSAGSTENRTGKLVRGRTAGGKTTVSSCIVQTAPLIEIGISALWTTMPSAVVAQGNPLP